MKSLQPATCAANKTMKKNVRFFLLILIEYTTVLKIERDIESNIIELIETEFFWKKTLPPGLWLN